VSHLSKVMHMILQIMGSVKINPMSYLYEYSNNIIKIWNSLFLRALAQVTESARMLSHVHPSTRLHVIDSPHGADLGPISYQTHRKTFHKSPNFIKIIQKYQALFKNYVSWYCQQAYKTVCSITMQRLPTAAFPWQHLTVTYCWQWHMQFNNKNEQCM